MVAVVLCFNIHNVLILVKDVLTQNLETTVCFIKGGLISGNQLLPCTPDKMQSLGKQMVWSILEMLVCIM